MQANKDILEKRNCKNFVEIVIQNEVSNIKSF